MEPERQTTGDDTGIRERAEAELASAQAPATPEPMDPRSEAAGRIEAGRGPLLPEDELGTFRERWDAVQVGFVDKPRTAVEQADALVEELTQRLVDSFTRERANLEARWEGGSDVSTEDLRVALQRYRTFFDRLLAA